MRKIDVRPYSIVMGALGGQEITEDFKVKESIEICLFHPQLNLDGRELMKRRKILHKIEEAEDFLLLEEDEWEKLKQAFETIKGLSKNELPLVERIIEAEEIEVKEKGA